MWLFCEPGFFSAVQHEADPGIIHLRARFKGDLERLFSRHGLKADVQHTPGNDYAYRADVPKADWAAVVAAEAEAISYTNFKNHVHDGTPRDRAYMETWAAMRHAQS